MIENEIENKSNKWYDLLKEINKLLSENELNQLKKLDKEYSEYKEEEKKLENKESKIKIGDKRNEYIIKYYNSFLYKIIGKKLSSEQIKELLEAKDVKDFDIHVFDFIIKEFGNEKIIDGVYHVIFRNIMEDDGLDNYLISRTNLSNK